jgi:hypothetical protein
MRVNIQEGDTIESVIRRSGGLDQSVAQTWQQVVTLNNLEYPYIAPDSTFQTDFYASGTVVVYGTPSTSIPAGTLVATSGEDIIVFRVQATAVVGVNGSVSLSVVAVLAGDFANVRALTIVQFVDETGQAKTISGISRIENPQAMTGGRVMRVLKPGQSLVIPVPAIPTLIEGYVERTSNTENDLFKIDIALDSNGDFTNDGAGDLSVVAGVQNMGVAILDRLRTERGELIKHPEYGLNIGRLIGEGGDKYHVTVIKLDLTSTILTDPRVKGINDMVVAKIDDAVGADMNLLLIDETTRPTQAVIPT